MLTIDVNGLRCQIVSRFDRIGIAGRRAVVTLAAASRRTGVPWIDAVEELERDGRLSNNVTPRPTVNTLAVWDDARTLINEFWQRASEQRLSDSMQTIITEHVTQ